jgi:hypothetical protein
MRDVLLDSHSRYLAGLDEEFIMKIRIAVLITGAFLVGATGIARAALQPLDPDHAPIAVVDRFSDVSGTLLIHVFRARTNRLISTVVSTENFIRID